MQAGNLPELEPNTEARVNTEALYVVHECVRRSIRKHISYARFTEYKGGATNQKDEQLFDAMLFLSDHRFTEGAATYSLAFCGYSQS